MNWQQSWVANHSSFVSCPCGEWQMCQKLTSTSLGQIKKPWRTLGWSRFPNSSPFLSGSRITTRSACEACSSLIPITSSHHFTRQEMWLNAKSRLSSLLWKTRRLSALAAERPSATRSRASCSLAPWVPYSRSTITRERLVCNCQPISLAQKKRLLVAMEFLIASASLQASDSWSWSDPTEQLSFIEMSFHYCLKHSLDR